MQLIVFVAKGEALSVSAVGVNVCPVKSMQLKYVRRYQLMVIRSHHWQVMVRLP